MARIRTIKPEFWQDERIARLDCWIRLLFIGLWNMADDEGRMRGSPLFVRAQVFPYDMGIDVAKGLDELQKAGRIIQFENGGESYIEIVNWKKHQKIDRPTSSAFPASSESKSSIRRVLDEHSSSPRRVLDEHSSGERKGKEGTGKDQLAPPASPEPLALEPTDPPPAQKKPTDPRWKPTQDALTAAYAEATGTAYKWQGAKDSKALGELLKLADTPEILRRYVFGLRSSGWLNAPTVAQLASKWNDIGVASPPPLRLANAAPCRVPGCGVATAEELCPAHDRLQTSWFIGSSGAKDRNWCNGDWPAFFAWLAEREAA